MPTRILLFLFVSLGASCRHLSKHGVAGNETFDAVLHRVLCNGISPRTDRTEPKRARSASPHSSPAMSLEPPHALTGCAGMTGVFTASWRRLPDDKGVKRLVRKGIGTEVRSQEEYGVQIEGLIKPRPKRGVRYPPFY